MPSKLLTSKDVANREVEYYRDYLTFRKFIQLDLVYAVKVMWEAKLVIKRKYEYTIIAVKSNSLNTLKYLISIFNTPEENFRLEDLQYMAERQGFREISDYLKTLS